MPLKPGTRLGPYEITALLGEGGMGSVYQAQDVRLGRAIALKVLRGERGVPLERLLQEARAASALNHPNILAIHDIASADGIDFIVMEFAPGKTLDQMIPRGGMRLGEALKIALQIAEA